MSVRLSLSYYTLYNIMRSLGVLETLLSSTMISLIIVIILIFFLILRSSIALFVSLLYSSFILLISPIFFDFDKGIIGSIMMIFKHFSWGHYQMAIMILLAWLIPIVSAIGVAVYFYDKNKQQINEV